MSPTPTATRCPRSAPPPTPSSRRLRVGGGGHAESLLGSSPNAVTVTPERTHTVCGQRFAERRRGRRCRRALGRCRPWTHPDRLVSHPRLLHHQGKSHLRPGVRRHAAWERRSLALDSDVTSRRTIMRWPSSLCLLDNYFGPGDQSALGHRWVLQAYPSAWMNKLRQCAQRRESDAARSERLDPGQRESQLHERSRLRRARRQSITPSSAAWTEIYNDWKNRTRMSTLRPPRLSSDSATSTTRDIPPSIPGSRISSRGQLPRGIR